MSKQAEGTAVPTREENLATAKEMVKGGVEELSSPLIIVSSVVMAIQALLHSPEVITIIATCMVDIKEEMDKQSK